MAASLRDLERPDHEAAWSVLAWRAHQDGAGAVNEEHADVRVALLAYRAEAAGEPARVLARREAEVACEATTALEALGVSDETDEGGGGEEADSGNQPELRRRRNLLGESSELVLRGLDASLELADLLAGSVNSFPSLLSSLSRTLPETVIIFSQIIAAVSDGHPGRNKRARSRQDSRAPG